jgi:hypothetical protein
VSVKNSKFIVDGRLTKILGENYKSTESALKELIDNAWDAEATIVKITLPTQMKSDSIIIIEDNGMGMSTLEVENDYLRIARDRISIKGNKTSRMQRTIKGRKGIGKFAGFVTAHNMNVETIQNNILTRFSIDKDLMIKQVEELDKFNLELYSSNTIKENGTRITLTELDLCLLTPSADRLKELLILDYWRENSFDIYINDVKLEVSDIGGVSYKYTTKYQDIGEVMLDFNITDKDITNKRAGIILRVGGKIVGSPSFFDIDEAEDIPRKLLKKIYGEIIADGLVEYVNADWTDVLQNSIAYQKIRDFVYEKLHLALKENFTREISLMKARIQKKVNESLKSLPEHKRTFAKASLERVLNEFYQEPEHKLNNIINVMLEAIEKDEYYKVIEEINRAKRRDIIEFSEALSRFGLADMSTLMSQAVNRINFLDSLDELIRNTSTTELQIHKVLEQNLWVFGTQYNLMSSNETNKKIIDEYLGKKYKGTRADKRPDLLLCNKYMGNYLLIEFKRPNVTLSRENELQAQKYRDDMKPYLSTDRKIEILMVGGKIGSDILSNDSAPLLKNMTFNHITSQARDEINWLIENIKVKMVHLID